MKAFFTNPWTTLVIGMVVAYVGISLFTGNWKLEKVA